MNAALARPTGWSRRDMLCGVLAVTAAELKLPAALDFAAKVCKPLFAASPAPPNWFPVITHAHAYAAIRYAGRALKLGAMTQDEYDFVCGKARRAILTLAGDTL